jgi:hypothetical protein
VILSYPELLKDLAKVSIVCNIITILKKQKEVIVISSTKALGFFASILASSVDLACLFLV